MGGDRVWIDHQCDDEGGSIGEMPGRRRLDRPLSGSAREFGSIASDQVCSCVTTARALMSPFWGTRMSPPKAARSRRASRHAKDNPKGPARRKSMRLRRRGPDVDFRAQPESKGRLRRSCWVTAS